MKKEEKLLKALEGLKRGEKEGFEVFYSQTYYFVYARAKHTTQNEQEALKLMQEVYLTASREIKDLKESMYLYFWLGTIIVRQRAKMERKAAHQVSEEQKRLFEEMEDISMKMGEKSVTLENARLLQKMIEKLPGSQKAVLIEYYYDGLKIDEIADLTESNKETVTGCLYLARKQLRDIIEEMEQTEENKLCGFNTPLIIWAVGILLEDTKMSRDMILQIYENVCKSCGIVYKSISFGEAGKSFSMEQVVGAQARGKTAAGKKGIKKYL